MISELKKQTNKQNKTKTKQKIQSARVLETLRQYTEEEYLEGMLLFRTGGSEAIRDISVQWTVSEHTSYVLMSYSVTHNLRRQFWPTEATVAKRLFTFHFGG